MSKRGGYNNKDRTVTRSFRISESSLKALEDEARRQNIGVSTLLNQQLLAFADFERYLRRLGLVKLSSATFQRLLTAGSEKDIAAAGSGAGSDTPKSIILAKYGVFNLGTVIDYLTMMSEFSGQFEFGEVQAESKRVLTLLHRLGPKGSIFFSSYMKALFEQIGLDPRISTSEHSVLIEIIPQKEQITTF